VAITVFFFFQFSDVEPKVAISHKSIQPNLATRQKENLQNSKKKKFRHFNKKSPFCENSPKKIIPGSAQNSLQPGRGLGRGLGRKRARHAHEGGGG
jgi:hypothetical protein